MNQSFQPVPDIPFILDTTDYSDIFNPDDNMLTFNWVDWDEFVCDAQCGPNQML
jgi:hypothetical protein